MGYIEEKSAKLTRNQNLKGLILGSVAIAGGLALALVAPNVIGAMAKVGFVPKTRQLEYINAARKRLKKQGLLVERDGRLQITERGRVQLRTHILSLARPQRLKRWDKKWRVLIFDIPEKRKRKREGIRRQLRASGFMRVQDSVWMHPFPCEEFVALLKSELRIGKDLLYLVVDSMEGDAAFRAHFGLPLENAPGKPVQIPKTLDILLEPLLPKVR